VTLCAEISPAHKVHTKSDFMCKATLKVTTLSDDGCSLKLMTRALSSLTKSQDRCFEAAHELPLLEAHLPPQLRVMVSAPVDGDGPPADVQGSDEQCCDSSVVESSARRTAPTAGNCATSARA
jgi:hypothetical protein